MRIKWRTSWLAGAFVAASLMLGAGAHAGDTPVVHVKAVVKDGAVSLEAQADGPFDYTTYRPSANLFVLDLTGVSDGDPAGARVIPSDLVKGYRVQTYSVGGKPVVRVEILLNHGTEPKIQKTDAQNLVLMVGANADAAASAPAATPAATTTSPVQAATASATASSSPVAATTTTVAVEAPKETPVARVKPAPVTPAKAGIVEASATSADTRPVSFQSIRDVKLQENGSDTNVNVIGSGPLNYQVTRLQNPDRLVLDFQGAQLKTTQKHIASNLDPVKQIRLAQFSPEVSRMVIDLRESADYKVNADGNSVTVMFAGAATRGAAKSVPAPADPTLTTTKAAVAPKPEKVETAVNKRAAIPMPVTGLPPTMSRSSAFAAPVNAPAVTPAAAQPISYVAPTANVPAPPPAPQPAPAVPRAQEAVAATNLATEAAAASTANNAVSAPTPQPVASNVGVPVDPVLAVAPQPVEQVPPTAPATRQAPAPRGSGRYTGEPISVNLKDVDLHDFFRLIHEISGLNVVVDPSVKGTLTIVLDDVPWDQALDIVLHNNDLDKQLDGNVLRIATKDTLRKEAEESRDLAKAQAEAADVVTTTRVLSYAKASAMAGTIKRFLSSRGDVLADDRSNSLIIRDIPSTMPVIDNLIRELDRKSQQVEIESRIVSATRSFSREIGNTFALGARGGNNVVGGTGSVGTDQTTFTPAPPLVIGSGGSGQTSGQLPLLTSLGTVAPTSGVSYLFQSANFALDYVIDAAEARGVGKLLSKPKVITQNNQKATVKQGTKIPVQTVVNNTVSVQFVDAVLELDVTPQITADGTIYMDVTLENDQIDQGIPRVQGIPAIDTQSAETKVTVVDGSTIVIGGIIVTQQNTSVQDVPVVGSLPLIGNLFKHSTVSSTSQELLFFLTPRILPG
jgi:type IV pilus assembly protein PilQ